MTVARNPSAVFAAHDVQAQLQQIVDHTSAAVFVKDLEGRYLFVNREFERLTGIPVAEIVGRCDSDLFPSAAGRLRHNDLRVIEERRELDFEETIETASGPRIYLSRKFPLVDDGGPAYPRFRPTTDLPQPK